MSGLIESLFRWMTEMVYSFGYAGVFVLTALGNLHLPVPTQITLPLTGYLIEQGRFSFVPAMVWSTAAAVAVSLVFYYLGLRVGEENLRGLIGRVERFKLVSGKDLDKANRMFERHGGKAILIGHLVPGIGAFISIPAGLTRMPILWRFAFYTALGSILYNAAHIGLGWVLGANWMLVKEYASIIEYAVLAAVALGIAWFLWRRWESRG
jgi:membrane protein DedA with SNARE-associated domain